MCRLRIQKTKIRRWGDFESYCQRPPWSSPPCCPCLSPDHNHNISKMILTSALYKSEPRLPESQLRILQRQFLDQNQVDWEFIIINPGGIIKSQLSRTCKEHAFPCSWQNQYRTKRMTPSFVEWASPVGNDMIITRYKTWSFDCDGYSDAERDS